MCGPTCRCSTIAAPTVLRRVTCLESQQVIGWSVYGAMANNWLQHFPLSQLMLINSNALEVNTLAILRKVEAFLGLQGALRARTIPPSC